MFGNDVSRIDIMFGVNFCHFFFNIVHFHALPHKLGLGINYARFTPQHYDNQPDTMTFVSPSQFHVYLLWGHRPFSIVS